MDHEITFWDGDPNSGGRLIPGEVTREDDGVHIQPDTVNSMSGHPDGWRVGDRVEVGSVFVVPRRPRGPGRPWSKGQLATGHIERFTKHGGIVVRFDCGPVGGTDTCCTSSRELTRIE